MKRPTWQQGTDGRRIVVPEPVLRESPGGSEYSFSIWLERHHGDPLLLQTVTYSLNVPVGQLRDPGSAALLAVLLPAMRIGLPLRIEAPVSPLLLQNALQVRDIFSTWLEELSAVDLDAPAAPLEQKTVPDQRGTGSLFSLGVDGFHTLGRHRDSITDLVFIHGFDIDLDRHAHRGAVQGEVAAAAEALGKSLITVQTNARSFADSYLWWGHYCGFVPGAAVQLLTNRLKEVYFASSASYDGFVAFGTNALTDPLLSSDQVAVIHDGGEFTRMQKVEQLAADPFALRHLRVCWEMEGSAQNCGHCDKCLRTMTSLHLLGALKNAPTFPPEIDLAAVRKLRLGEYQLTYVREHLEKARMVGLEDSPLMQAWAECAARSQKQTGAALDAAFVKSLSRHDRDLLLQDLRQHVPDDLCHAAARHAGRSRGEVFDFLWKHHRPALLKALFRGGKP